LADKYKEKKQIYNKAKSLSQDKAKILDSLNVDLKLSDERCKELK